MINKDNKIETLEKELETIRNEIKTHEENQVNIKHNKNFHQKFVYRKMYKMISINLKPK